MGKKEKGLRIRNNMPDFLIFTDQLGKPGIEMQVAEKTVWLIQKFK